jgi:hypothetical protein
LTMWCLRRGRKLRVIAPPIVAVLKTAVTRDSPAMAASIAVRPAYPAPRTDPFDGLDEAQLRPRPFITQPPGLAEPVRLEPAAPLVPPGQPEVD